MNDEFEVSESQFQSAFDFEYSLQKQPKNNILSYREKVGSKELQPDFMELFRVFYLKSGII